MTDDFSPEDLNDEQLEELLLEDAVEATGAGSFETGITAGIRASLNSTEQVIQRYSHCDLCGGRLHFVYSTDFSCNSTHEKVSCPECGLDARKALHRLQ